MSEKRLEKINNIKRMRIDGEWVTEVSESVLKILLEQNNRYRETIELVKDELKNAINPSKSKGVREVYVENCIRFLNEALESESNE